MVDAPKYTDECLDRFFSGIMSLVPRESKYPLWFACADILESHADDYAQVIGKKFSPKVKDSYADLRLALVSVRAGLDEGVGPATEKCLRAYVEICMNKVDERVGGQQVLRDVWRSKQASGVQRGHHHQFRAQLDKRPEWLERRPNGKGWVILYKDIVKALAAAKLPVPDSSTVHRIRTSALKKIGEPQ